MSPTTSEQRAPGEAVVTGIQVITEPLGGSPLSLAAQRGDVPAHWYRARPTSVPAWRAYARDVAQAFSSGEWLDALGPALAASGAAASRLRRVVTGQGVVVTTGQQPGLFGGPVYTFSKALTAIAIADELESRLDMPVAPVFWAATDDADFGEARWTKVVIDAHVVRLDVPDQPLTGTPMSEARLGDLTSELAELERASGSAPFASALDAARAAYRAGTTIGGAYVALLRALLEPHGVAVLDASSPAVRRQGAALLRRALSRARELAAALAARTAELRAAGFEPQVSDAAELSLVFATGSGTKRRIAIDEAPRVAESAALETLGPNVLLRPVLERAVLPSIGYAAGPAELAYFAQVSAVADALGVERPLAFPRWSGTIIEPHVGRILRRLGIEHTDLRDPHELERRLAHAAMPAGVASSLAHVRDTIDRASAALTADAEAAALVPGAAVAGAKGALLIRLARLERRYLAALKRREADVGRQVATARAHLYPDGDRQERALNFLPMLSRQGPPLLVAMGHAARAHAEAVTGTRR